MGMNHAIFFGLTSKYVSKTGENLDQRSGASHHTPWF